MSAGAGHRNFCETQTQATRRTHGASESAVQRLHDFDPANQHRRAAGGKRRSLPHGLLFVGPGKAGLPPAAIARSGREWTARADLAAVAVVIGSRLFFCVGSRKTVAWLLL